MADRRAQAERVDVVGALARRRLHRPRSRFGLFLPLIGFRDRRQYQQRTDPDDALAAVVRVRRHRRWPAASSIPSRSRRGWRGARSGRAQAAPPAWRGYLDKWFVPFAIGFVIAYPVIVILTAGSAAR